MNNMSDRAMSAWSTLTSQWGSPLTLKSAYRDPVQNALANGARDSQHLHGNAFDVSTAGMSPEERASLIQAAQAAGFTGFGGYDNSLHFDVGPSRTWGSDYSGATTPDWLRSALGSAPVQVSTSGGPSMPMQEQPRGLFGFLGGEQTPDARTADQRKADLFNTLALGFNEMRLRPSQSLATGIQSRMASDRQLRTQQGRANRTVEWLKTQPNGSTAIQMIDAGADPAQAIQWLQQQNQAAASLARGEIKEVDGRLVRVMPDGTVQEIYGGSGAMDAPTVTKVTTEDGSEVAVQWDEQSGQWVPLSAPEGAIPTRRPLTAEQSKTTLFQSMQTQTAPVIDAIEQQWNPANMTDAVARATPIAGNFFASSQGQQYNAAAEAWSEGALRIATGAAATPAEKEAVMRTYFARPGDTPETIAFKNQLRKAYQESINLSLGQGTGYQLPIPTQFAADTLSPVDQIAVDDAFAEMEALLSQAGAGGQ